MTMKNFLKVYKKTAILLITVIFTFWYTGAISYAELPDVEILGGSYGDIRDQDYDTSKFHVHHLISKEAWKRLGDELVSLYGITPYNEFITDDYDQSWAPAILMEKEDHEQTRSYCSPDRLFEASAYIDYETDQLLTRGAVMQLLNDECDDIRAKFGDKYDEAIAQMFESITGQFRHKGSTLFINMGEFYVKYRFGCEDDSYRYVRKICKF